MSNISILKKKKFLLYIYIYIYIFMNSNKSFYFLINKKIYNKNFYLYKNFYYIFFYLLFQIFKLNFNELNKINKYFKLYNKNNINNFFLKYKDNNLLIFLESYKINKIIHKYKYNYLYKDKKITIYLYKNFKFRTEIYIYLIYRDYIEFIKRYKYNEYLDENPIIFKYPLLKILLRNIDQELLQMIKKKESEFIKREDIIKNYDMYNLNIIKINKKYLNIWNVKYLNIFYKNEETLKLLLLLLKSNKFIKEKNLKKLSQNIFLYFFWLRKIAHYEITRIYDYELEGYDWTKSEKLKSDNIYDFYWQMNRYGFMLYYYLPINIHYYFYNFMKNKIIKIYNLLFIIKYSKRKK